MPSAEPQTYLQVEKMEASPQNPPCFLVSHDLPSDGRYGGQGFWSWVPAARRYCSRLKFNCSLFKKHTRDFLLTRGTRPGTLHSLPIWGVIVVLGWALWPPPVVARPVITIDISLGLGPPIIQRCLISFRSCRCLCVFFVFLLFLFLF